MRDPDHADSTMVANAWMAITEKMGLKDGGEFHPSPDYGVNPPTVSSTARPGPSLPLPIQQG